MAFWHQACSDKCFFQLLIPGSTPVSLLESKSGFEIVTQLKEPENVPSSHLLSMHTHQDCILALGKIKQVLMDI
jgi:hypothetical protein